MDAYAHTAGMWLVGEDTPQESNRVTLDGEVSDQHGLAAPNVHFDDQPNDVAMRDHAWERGTAVYDAVGAEACVRTPVSLDPQRRHLPHERAAAGRRRERVRPDPRRGQPVRLRRQRLHHRRGRRPTLTIVAPAIRPAEHIGERIRTAAL